MELPSGFGGSSLGTGGGGRLLGGHRFAGDRDHRLGFLNRDHCSLQSHLFKEPKHNATEPLVRQKLFGNPDQHKNYCRNDTGGNEKGYKSHNAPKEQTKIDREEKSVNEAPAQLCRDLFIFFSPQNVIENL